MNWRLSWSRLPGNATARNRTRDLSMISPSPTPYNHYITEPPNVGYAIEKQSSRKYGSAGLDASASVSGRCRHSPARAVDVMAACAAAAAAAAAGTAALSCCACQWWFTAPRSRPPHRPYFSLAAHAITESRLHFYRFVVRKLARKQLTRLISRGQQSLQNASVWRNILPAVLLQLRGKPETKLVAAVTLFGWIWRHDACSCWRRSVSPSSPCWLLPLPVSLEWMFTVMNHFRCSCKRLFRLLVLVIWCK